MKKIFLAIFLLALVVGISYLKLSRQSVEKSNAYREGRHESEKIASEKQQQLDSLGQILVEKETAFTDSLTSIEGHYATEMDSLSLSLGSERLKNKELSSQIDNLKKKTNTPKKQTKNTSFSKTEATKHKQILDYYKRRFVALPKDLSDYEKKVARNEIREETVQKFSITLKELDNIRNKYKVEY